MIIFKDKVYDILRWIVQIVLPACATLYFALSGIWMFPYTEEIVGTIISVNVYLGALLGISNIQYQYARIKYLDVTKRATEQNEESKFPFRLSDEAYTLLKWIVLIFMPATGGLYLTLSKLWGFPMGTEVVASIAAITAFLGVSVGISSATRVKFSS